MFTFVHVNQNNERISTEQKICNTCRTSYYVWKNNNPEFGKIFSRLEKELSNVSAPSETTTVNRKIHFFRKCTNTFILPVII